MSEEPTIPSFGAMLRTAIGDAIIAEAETDFLGMCADDIVFQFPFAPAGSVREIRGKVRLAAYLQQVGALITFEGMRHPVTHVCKNGTSFILEFSCEGCGTKTGARYDQDYISVIQIRDGKIVHYRDYWNPLVLLEALGGVEVLTSDFKEFINV